MEQVSPIGILPQASYIDYIPTVEKELDYKTLFSVEQQRVNAAYKKKQDQISNRIKLEGNLDKLQFDKDSPLNMVGDNDYQRSLLKEINDGAQPIINEITALQSNPNLDVNAVLNLESKLTQQLYNNTGFRKVIQDKVKRTNIEKLFPGLDPDAVDEFNNAYYSYSGANGEINPLDTFNPAAMKPWDENKYNNQLKGIYTDEADAIINLPNSDGEYRGTILKDTASIDAELDRVWGLNQKALTKQGFDYDSWKTSKRNDYYRGALKDVAGNLVRVTASPTAASMKDSDGSDSKSTKDKKPEGPPVFVGADGFTYIPEATNNSRDGWLGGNQTTLNPVLLSPANQMEINTEQKTALTTRAKELEQQQAILNKQFGSDDTKWTPEQKAAYNELGNERISITQDLRSIDNNIKELKNNDFYKSREFKQYAEKGGSIGNQIAYGLGLVTKEEGKYLDDLKDQLGKDGEGFWSGFNKYFRGEQFFMGIPQKVEDKIKYIEKYKVEAVKEGKSTKPFDDYIAYIRSGENEAFDKYANRVQKEGTGAKGANIGYSLDKADPDVKSITDKYEGQNGVTAVNSATGGIRLVNGTKYKGSEDDTISTKEAVYDPITGTWGLRALIGEATKNKTGEVQYNKATGDVIYDGSPKEAIISDTNINRQLLNSFLIDTPGAANVAEKLFVKLAKSVDLKQGSSTSYNNNGKSFKVTNIGNGQYTVTADGETEVIQNKLQLARYISLKSIKEQTTNTTNTSGGGNGGKLESQSSSIKEGIRQAESGGEKDPARARNKETNALGYFGLVPSSQFDKLTPFVTKNWREFGVDLSKYTPEAIAAFKKELGRKEGAKGYSDEDIKAYMAIQDHPEMQDAYFDKVLMPKQYLPNVNKIIAAYAKNGKNINEAQAIDIMHHHGIGNAQDGNWQKYPARAWAASYQGENKKETQDVNNRIKNYNFTFQSGQSIKGVNSSLIDSTKHLIVKSGLDSLGPQFSSGHRKGGGKSDHDHGNAVDFKFKSESQELEAINKIAALTGNPTETRNMLLKGKGTNGYNIPPVLIKIKDTGQTLKIIYHGDSDGSGNHLHIQL